MKKKYILTVTLNPVIDKTILIPDFKIGKDYRICDAVFSAGGKGINVSRVLKSLKKETCVTGFLPQDGETFFKNELKREKITNDFFIVPGKVREHLTICDAQKKKITRILERGPSVTARLSAEFQKKYKTLLVNARAVVISGRSIPGAPASFCARLVQDAHDAAIPVFFDSSGQSFIAGLSGKPYMIKPNKEEAEEFFGKNLRSESAIRDALKTLQKKYARIVVMTDGSRASYAFNGEEFLSIRPPHLKSVNPVGCGDAFLAGFIAHFLDSATFRKTLRFASACGSANALSLLPGDLNQKKVESLVKKVVVTSLLKKENV